LKDLFDLEKERKKNSYGVFMESAMQWYIVENLNP